MNKSLRLLSLVVLTLAITLNSCMEEDLDGFFGDPVERFLGSWKCEETGDIQGYFGPYDVMVVRNPGTTNEVLIKNFYYQGMDISARAIISGNTITIPRQSICDDTIEIQGSGSYGYQGFTLNYKTNDGADEENISARYFK